MRAPDSATGIFDAEFDAAYFGEDHWNFGDHMCYRWAGGPPKTVPDMEAIENDADSCTDEEDDLDADGIKDWYDNCPNTHNPDQIDSDGDGLGNVCDSAPCPDYQIITGSCGAALDGCIEGFYCSRETIACEQEVCPEGAGRTYTLECCCDCWEDKSLRGVYDPCRPGFLLRCVPR